MYQGAQHGDEFRRISLLGLGVMGASLGMAIKRVTPDVRVTGYARREATRHTAADMGVADRFCDDPADAVADADLVIGCLPILALAPMFRQILPALTDHAVLTDVGSTKQVLDTDIRGLIAGTGRVYIGSHPMTGTEKSGPAAARADLYHAAPVFLTPAASDDPARIAQLQRFWEAVGARVYIVPPQVHDRCAARTSHLPHLIAAALVAATFRDRPQGMQPFIGPGFRDTTRIADGSPDIWHDIVRTNRDALIDELDAFQDIVRDVCDRLRENDFEAVRRFLDQARTDRRREVLSACEP